MEMALDGMTGCKGVKGRSRPGRIGVEVVLVVNVLR